MRDTLRVWTEAVETFVLQVILEERRDKAADLVRALLFLLSKVFLVVVKLRRFLYNVRLLRDSTLGVQVIAIGNITVGGTGKTPVVEKSGAANSTLVANLGPTFKDVRHIPVIPAASQAITVSGLVGDPQGVSSVTLKYSENGGAVLSATMALGADGRWAGTIPGQSASAVVQFWLEGRDGSNALGTWPAAAQNSRALIQVADNRADATRQNIRVTMTTADSNALYTANDMMSARHRGCTIVHNESEVFYDSETRLHGSMFTRNAPGNGSLNLYLPRDHPFRGVHSKIRVRISGKNEIVVKHLISAEIGRAHV